MYNESMDKYEVKKYHAAIAIVVALFVGIVIGNINILHLGASLPALPLPEITDGQRGELGIDKNINEIAYEVGFTYPRYFSTSFKLLKGVTPTHFKKENRG